MQQDEVDIVDFLVRRFAQTACFRQKHLLMPQADSYVDATRKRIPNLAYFTPEQRQAMRRGERVNTLFAIEILSESETHHPERRPDVLDKIQDYFDGGARLVWYIIPSHQRIDAYTSPENSTVFRGQQPITAAPVLPEFGFVVAELFA